VPESAITRAAEIPIVPLVGPEVIAGSTRMKAGTAQKLILNMLSTATMIRLGYVTGNRMTSVQTRNVKLRERALRILMAETGLSEPAAMRTIDLADGDLRLALVMTKTGNSRETAEAALKRTRWVVADAVRELSS
jgi:N-acetylmuramic acid 6-phosphate etherase